LSSQALTQDNDVPAVLRFTTKEGLSNNTVFCLAQDRFGFIWLATWDGLTRFDGFSFKNFRHDPNDPASLPYFWPRHIISDGIGNLWVTTQTVSRFDREREQFISYRPDSKYYCSSKRIYSAAVDVHGGYYVFGTNGISRYNQSNDRFDDVKTIFKLDVDWKAMEGSLVFDGECFWIFDWTNRRILLGKQSPDSKNGSEIIFDRFVSFPCTPVKSGNYVQEISVHQTKTGSYFVASNHGLFFFDPAKDSARRLINVPDSLLSGLDHDMVWSSVDEGLLFYSSAVKKIIHFTKGITHRVNNAFLDNTGNIWFGSVDANGTGTGLNQISFKKSPWKHFSLQLKRNEETVSVFALWEDKNSTDLYIGTSNYPQLLRLRGDYKLEKINLPKTIVELSPRSISQDLAGRLWVGTREGYLFQSDVAKKQFYQIYPKGNNYPESFSFHTIKILRFLQNDGMLAAGHSGIAVFEAVNNLIDKVYINNTGKGDFYSCYADTTGRFWAGGCGELFEISTRMNILNKIVIGNGQYNIEDIVQAGDSGLWLALLGGGLCYYNLKSGDQTIYSSHDGLRNNVVYCILPDRKNNLWLSTNDGLSFFNVISRHFINYGVEDGLSIKEFNSDACLRRRNGSMVFGGMGGIVAFDPDSVVVNNEQYKPLLCFQEIIGQSKNKDHVWYVCGRNTQTLDNGIKNLRIVFSRVDFQGQQLSRFRYRVKGLKEDWDIVPDGARFFDINGLEPGRYEVFLASSGIQGQWSLETSIVLFIPPFFYETWWFKFLIVIIFACLIGVIIYLKMHHLSLLQKHRVACLKQLAMQQQLNPHFISNALQAIESLAASGDELILNEYVSCVYSLMRRMIDYTGREYVGLTEEIDIITDYLKAEQLRVGFSFKVIDEFRDQDPAIAASFIQPFLENSILHGIQVRKDSDGHITVTFSQRNNHSVFCSIEDNGPGFITGSKNSKKSRGESKGIGIIKERLKIYQSLTGKLFELRISSNQKNDIYPGTIVTIEIPVKKELT
jgi:ligand-binding sensor domain-containing protein